jgi:hypothetical protein
VYIINKVNATANIPRKKKSFISFEYGYRKSRCNTQSAGKQLNCTMMKPAKHRMVELVFMA